MKLISMTDFVLEQNKTFTKGKPLYETKWDLEFEKFSKLLIRYAQFLKQPLTLGMFVPTDEKGNIVEYKKMTVDGCPIWDGGSQWQKAKQKVLFKGFYVEFNTVKSPQGGHLDVGNLQNKTIETIIGAELELTESAIKQIGLNP